MPKLRSADVNSASRAKVRRRADALPGAAGVWLRVCGGWLDGQLNASRAGTWRDGPTYRFAVKCSAVVCAGGDGRAGQECPAYGGRSMPHTARGVLEISEQMF
jgi:hypothetical protein